MPDDGITDRIEVKAKIVETLRVQQASINAANVANAASTAKQAGATGLVPVPELDIPQTADDCDLYFDSSAALFIHNFGLSDADGNPNKGKEIYCFVRYGSLKHQHLNGDYSEVIIIVLK